MTTTTTRMEMTIITTLITISQPWDLIETWGFHKDIMGIKGISNDDDDDNDNKDDDDEKDDNDNKDISTLGIDRDMGF